MKEIAEGHVAIMATVTEQLKDLAALRKDGVLTDEEFAEQKAIILAESRARATSSASDPTMLTEVGAYRLLGLIGEGGMGAVYRGRHRSETMAERQGGDVAVKVIHPQFARDPDYRDRFEREAALGLELDHPGIVKVHDLVVDGGNLALVMDCVDGRPLSESIGEVAGPIPWDEAWPLFRKLLEAVGYAHGQGVVHRDIKPENILVTPDGEPHVIDFGIAKNIDSSGTRTGTGMGTVEYMAPEQYIDAKAVDQRADIYSLGMILYEMLAGRLPWDADAPQFRILEQKANKELMSPSAFCSDIPPEIVAALSPALAADPGERPTSPTAFSEAMEDASNRARSRRRDEKEIRRTTEKERSQSAAQPHPTESKDVDSRPPRTDTVVTTKTNAVGPNRGRLWIGLAITAIAVIVAIAVHGNRRTRQSNAAMLQWATLEPKLDPLSAEDRSLVETHIEKYRELGDEVVDDSRVWLRAAIESAEAARVEAERRDSEERRLAEEERRAAEERRLEAERLEKEQRAEQARRARESAEVEECGSVGCRRAKRCKERCMDKWGGPLQHLELGFCLEDC